MNIFIPLKGTHDFYLDKEHVYVMYLIQNVK